MITGFYCLVDFVAHLACWKSLACGTMFFMKVEEEGGEKGIPTNHYIIGTKLIGYIRRYKNVKAR